MASKGLPSSLIRYVVKRGYADVCPAVKQASITTTQLANKIIVTGLDNGSPVTRVTVAFKAGSRYEPQTETGIAHVLRSAAGLSTGCASAFMLRRKLAQLGASFNASGDREIVYYTLETTQDNLPEALDCLNNLISNQQFPQWELTDNVPRLRYDISSLPPQVRAVDLLHKAAFRRGLGNSLFVSPRKIGQTSSESLQHYAATTLTPGRCAVVVVGDSEQKACLLAQNLQLAEVGAAPDVPTQYSGGDMRKEMGGDLAHIALALPGAPAGSKQSLALAAAAKALGNGPVTKWGGDNSPLARAIGNIGPFAAAGFNVSYSDGGLFGVVLSVPKDEAATATKAVASLLRSGQLSTSDITAGVNQLKLQVLSEAENGTSLAEQLAAQALYTRTPVAPADLARQVAGIGASDICGAMAQAAKCRLSMGAAGNLAFVPYVDEL